MEKIELSKFIKAVCFKGRKLETGEIQWVKLEVSFSPFHVTSYHKCIALIDGIERETVEVHVGGVEYTLDATFEKFDKFFDDVNRGMELKDEY